ncbi:GNAT family N-acetyltransferase [Paraliobacillus ryukyuensis]|uniref:GNAT family N-acetyltransferase n=1 Tax=Paraliobacillus ryukyuensis TaxID=200904 RepID=UPI0009A8DC9C|nr:GNAT family N-acetyltransferase [Paraliobacillus ryukyuensis]
MNPILLDFPDQFETERLLIRSPKPGDGKAVYQAIQASKEELKQWLSFAQKDQTEEETEINIREAYVKFIKREDLRLLLFNKQTGVLVGSSGLHQINWDVPRFEIGYWLDTRYSGQGYMTEAVQGICQFAFDELGANRIEICCDEKNQKSRAIPERLGFTLEGIFLKDSVAVNGNDLRDTCLFAKLKGA